MIEAYQLYTTTDGGSAFHHGWVDEDTFFEAKAISFARTDAGSTYEWHRAPRKQYVLTFRGELTFTTTDGKSFVLKPGTVLIAGDTEGKGHRWELSDAGDWIRSYVVFPEDQEPNFLMENGEGL